MKRPRVSSTRIKKALDAYEDDETHTLEFNILFVVDALRDLQDARAELRKVKQ